MSFTRIVALVALLFVGLVATESRQRYNLKENFDNTIVAGDLHDSLVSYIACDRYLEKSKTQVFSKKCNITHGIVDEKAEKKSCELEFAETMATTSFAIHALSSDKSVVIWVDEDTTIPHYLLKFTVVHFPSCNTFEAKIDFQNHKSLFNSMIRYENAFIPSKDSNIFDVFFENSKYCSDKVCRLTLNAQAEITNGPTPTYIPIKRLYDASTELHIVNHTYAVFESRRDDSGRISLITPDGQKILQETGTEGSDNNDISTLHDKIRLCRKIGETKISCELFNAKSESLSKNDIDIGYKFNSLTLFNLPNSEYLLETESRKHAYVTKIGAGNERIGAVKLSGYICKGGAASTVKDVYIENNQLCMARMCFSDTRVDVIQKCYNNADIK